MDARRPRATRRISHGCRCSRPIRRRGWDRAPPRHRSGDARRTAARRLAWRRLADGLHELRRGTSRAARRCRTDGGNVTSGGVRVERSGSVTTVIMNRPEARNAVNGPAATGLYEAFDEFDKDDSAAVAVLWGDNGTFCAGADLKAFGTPATNPVHRTGPGPMGPSRMVLSKPVIAAVSGYVVAGGLELALWCDMRVVEEDAIMGVFCRRWGVPLIDGGTVRLPRLIGHSRAMDMILTGRGVDAAEALAMGLANRVVPKGQARAAAEELAAQLAALPQLCLRADRLSALHQWGRTEEAAIDFEFGSLAKVSSELLAGAQRFVDGAGRHGAGS